MNSIAIRDKSLYSKNDFELRFSIIFTKLLLYKYDRNPHKIYIIDILGEEKSCQVFFCTNK